ncbi:MAG: hypothetical protein VYD19_10140, partial [Myxococcota bacterium]|nr:hypothetical protein [Myxococcota bacterium]
NEVYDYEMDHPSAYGSGGQGYGVHLIGASRSLIVGARVWHARHGVVVDFGSSESQILEGEFFEMNQALLDVHGEASRDTLIRANQLRDASIGVIVGGGGHEVHCNDGPRHHVQQNTISDCFVGVSVADETEEVFVRGNSFDENGSHVASAFGAREITVERNRFGAALGREISLATEGTGGMYVERNLFQRRCDAAAVTLILNGAEAPQFSENEWCPEQ